MLQGHHIFSLLFLFLGYVQLTNGEVYYITPSPSSPCPEQPCLTLSQILTNTSSIFNSNTTLLFLQGNHSLHSDLVIGNISQLKLLSLRQSSLESVTISCAHSAKILIDNVDLVCFGRLSFIGCSENQIKSVHHFVVNGSKFNGQHNTTGTALELNHILNATVVNSSFIFNTYGSFKGPIELPGLLQRNGLLNSIHARVGGALIISSSNVSVTDGYFEGNSAEVGGAIFIEGNSHIRLANSSFINNQAFSLIKMCFGGAIFCGAYNVTATTSDPPLEGNNTCMVVNSTFVNNRAAYGGGAIAALSANMFVLKSKILMNLATRGGAFIVAKSSLEIDDSHFELNSANQSAENSEAKFMQGGAILARTSSNITIFESVFHANSAFTSGGVIDTSARCKLIIMRSQFSNNWANVGGVIVVNYLSTVTISESMFENNTAEILGGVVFVNKRGVLNVATTTFVDNKSYYGGTLLLHNNATTYVNDSLFHNNSAFIGGVFGAFYESQISLINCAMIKNTANAAGGVGVAQSSIISMIESYVVNSTAQKGGVINAGGSFVQIESSKFEICEAHGGGVLLLEGGSQFLVQECEFRHNLALQGGVMYLINNSYGSVNTSHFEFNGAVYHGGVAYMQSEHTDFENCEFRHNTALKNGGVFRMDLHCEIHLMKTIFIKNHANVGGAIDFGIHGTRLAIIKESVFKRNMAKSYGGTLWIFLNTQLVIVDTYISESLGGKGVVSITGSNVSFEGSITFSSNYNSLYALNSVLYFVGNITFENNLLVPENKFYATNRILEFNMAAAITVYRCNIYIEGFTAFINNSANNGAAIHAVDSNIYVTESMLLTNNTATYNGGGIYLYQSRIQCRDDCSLNVIGNQASHSGGGICAISSIIEVIHTRGVGNYLPILSVHNNKAQMGGGMHMEANAKLYVLKVGANESFDSCCSVEFMDNIANYGGAISVADTTNVGVCNSNPHHVATLKQQHAENTECFMQVFNVNQIHFEHINTRSLTFSNNTALQAGSTLFGGLLDRCIASSYAEIYSSEIGMINLDGLYYGVPYFKNVSDILLDSVSSYPVKVCFCIHGQPNCNYTSRKKQVRKGETFTVNSVAVDQVDHIISNTTIHSYLMYTESGLGEGQLIQTTGISCTKLTYSITSVHEHEQLVIYAEGPCRNSTMSRKWIDVQFVPCSCPIGFQQSDRNTDCVCTCDTNLLPYISDCNDMEETVNKNTDAWISYYIDTALNSSGYLIHDHCPFDYCLSAYSDNKVSVNLNQANGSDAQCAYNRMGTLCGSCRPGFSLSLGSSKCLSCSHWHAKVSTIIVVTILRGILLVASLLVLNLTVAVGTLNGVIFYANIVASNFSTFLPFSSPNFITVFIAWLNLDIGLNTCFLQGLDSFWKLWMDIFFSAYLIGLVALVIVFSERSTKFARLVGRKNPVATLATLILLSYTKLLRTVILSLSFAILKYPDNLTRLVWLPDGTVLYLCEKHIALFIAGLVILILGAVYTILLFLWQWILLYQHKTIFKWARDQRLKNFLDPYHAPYIYKYRYWTGLLLFVRALLYIIAAVNVSNDPGINLLAVGCVMFSIVVLKSCLKTNKVYKSWPIDLLEMISYLNLTLLCLINFYLLLIGAKSGQRIVAYISGSITLILFIIISCYHFTFELILKSRIWNTMKRKWTDSAHSPQRDLDSCSETENDQATLIAPTFTEIECPPQGEIPLSVLVEHDPS